MRALFAPSLQSAALRARNTKPSFGPKNRSSRPEPSSRGGGFLLGGNHDPLRRELKK
jgi:hypothetical protein